MKTVLFALTGCVLMLLSLSPALAHTCRETPRFRTEDLDEMDLLVRATVMDVDDRGYSAVIHVADYYKGEGPKLLTVSRYNVGLETGNDVRGYDTGCLFSGRGHIWRAGATGYFGLSRSPFGTYTDYDGGSAHFYVWDEMITYRDVATEDFAQTWDATEDISEEDLIARMLKAGGREAPIAATIDQVLRYPLRRYLMITTENGTRYRVNPDRSVSPVELETVRFISPDDAHVALRVDNETMGFYFVWPFGYTPQHYEQMTKVAGRDLRFSNDSNMVAVWDESQLAVYLFRNKGPGDFLYWGVGMQMDLIANAPLQSVVGRPTTVEWSADSSTIAWQDDSGIWRWDLYEDAEASLIASENDIEGSRLLDLSASGRFVRYGAAGGWTLFDSHTRHAHENALASPGDRHLIFVNSAAKPINDWHETERCKPPLRENCAVYIGTKDAKTITVFPYQMELLGLVACDTDCFVWATSWHPAIEHDKTGMHDRRYIGDTISDLRQIAYDPTYNQPAILRGEYRIEFGFYESSYYEDEEKLQSLDYLHLAGEVDSPIASIEWGQPIFYDTFMLTATEHLPVTVTIGRANVQPNSMDPPTVRGMPT